MKKEIHSQTEASATTTPVWSAALLISGASLGAGLLALPIQTGLAGLIPALSGLVFIWALMFTTGLILAETFVSIGQNQAGLFTLYEHGLGKWSGWLVTPGFLLVFYGVLVAYLSGSGAILADLLDMANLKWLFLLLFFMISSTVVLVGMKFINRANAGFMFLLIGSFISLLVLVGANMDSSNLGYQDWKFLPSALPIIVCSFAYQNIIPSICSSLNNDRRKIKQAIFWGTLLTFMVNGLWIIVVMGVLPLADGSGSLLTAYQKNEPATIPLALDIHSESIRFWGLLFSMAALFTSYVAVGEGLRNFLADLLSNTRGQAGINMLVAGLTFVPPLIVSLVYPQIFLTMLNIVGGIGVVLLFGLLPALIYLRDGRSERQLGRQFIGLVLCGVFLVLIGLECCQELGLLQVHPQAEYWHDHDRMRRP